jgi:hypothetical protein
MTRKNTHNSEYISISKWTFSSPVYAEDSSPALLSPPNPFSRIRYLDQPTHPRPVLWVDIFMQVHDIDATKQTKGVMR